MYVKWGRGAEFPVILTEHRKHIQKYVLIHKVLSVATAGLIEQPA